TEGARRSTRGEKSLHARRGGATMAWPGHLLCEKSMAIVASCPACNSMFRVGDQYASKRVKCPKCGSAITVPGVDEAQGIASGLPRPVPHAYDAPSPPRHDDSEEDYVETEAVPEAPSRPRRRRRRDYEDVDEGIDEQERPRKLGSLAQAARGRKLTALRIILFIVGGLQLAVSISLLATIRDQARRHVDKALRDQGIFVPPPFV